MVRRLSSLFFRQSSQDNVAQAPVDNVQAGASRPGVMRNPLQRTDFSKKTVRHVKSSGALLGTLRSLQYSTQAPKPQPPLPVHSARGLGELQEYFWLEDSLHRTTSQLDRCSNQLDQIHGSAAEVRRELEGLQVELELLQKKIQNGVDHVKSEEPRKESPQPASTAPKAPEVVQAISIQRKDLDDMETEKARSEPQKPVDPAPTEHAVIKELEKSIQQNSPDRVQGEKSKSELPKSVDSVPRRPVIAKPSSIQQRIQFFSKIANN